MMDLDDPRWRSLTGAHRKPHDPTPRLRRIRGDWSDEVAWNDLWEALYHQGDPV
jgi:hypothetical protein